MLDLHRRIRNCGKEEVDMKVRSLLGILGPAILVAACSQSDAGITTSVKTQLAADDVVKAREINVDTRDKVVTLTGVVQSTEEETKALQIARNTKGVASVIDNISVAPPAMPGAEPTGGRLGDVPAMAKPVVTDAAITASVKTKLLADTTVGGLRIDVDTRDSVVTLKGTVGSEAERAKAVEIASKTDNVTSVNDQLTVKPKTR
jgi:hyperosmotically inducible protein